MAELYIVTGVNGHLGNTIADQLIEKGCSVRGLVLPGDRSAPRKEGLELYEGDVCDRASLEPIFALPEGDSAVVIHTAGIVSISAKFQQIVHDVNVDGTRNIIDMCKRPGVRRLVYISSVHAIPEGEKGSVIRETKEFDADSVNGLYAKTKAEATKCVLDAVAEGLDAVIVHPSGIIGPNDYTESHLSQLLVDYMHGRLAALVNGGYDFVDVRDVAAGVLGAAEHGKTGECYILSNRYYSVKDFMQYAHELSGKRRIKTVMPLWVAKAAAPFMEIYYRLMKQKPLYTSYSLYTLQANANFDHTKAERELGYKPRDIRQTIADTLEFLKKQKRI